MRAFLLLAAAVAGALLAGAPAIAGPTLTFNLNQISDPGIGSGSQGTVVLTQVSNTVVDVRVSIAPDLFINTGGPHTPFGFNNSLSGLSVSFVTPTSGIFAKGVLSYDPTGGQNTPYGTFGRAINSSAGNGAPGGYGGILDFTVTRALGLSTTDFAARQEMMASNTSSRLMSPMHWASQGLSPAGDRQLRMCRSQPLLR